LVNWKFCYSKEIYTQGIHAQGELSHDQPSVKDEDIERIDKLLKREKGNGVFFGIDKLSEFDQKLGNTRIHNSLIIQHSGYWPEVENQPNLP